MTEKQELREKIDTLLITEMVTIGRDADDAKTGQMWAFDSERLSKRIVSLIEPVKVSRKKITNVIKANTTFYKGKYSPLAGPITADMREMDCEPVYLADQIIDKFKELNPGRKFEEV